MSTVGNTTLAYETFVLATTQRVTSSLSFIGCLYVVVTFCAFEDIRKRINFRLATMLAVSDIGQQICTFLGTPGDESPNLCLFQAIFLSYTTLCTIIWPLFIAITLFLIVVKHDAHVERLEKWFHLFAWGVPVILTLLPFSTWPWGPAGILCWITQNNGGQYWRIFQVYFWVWCVIIVDAALYIAIIYHIRQGTKVLAGDAAQRSARRRNAELIRLSMYPLIMTVSYFWATVDRVQNMLGESPIFWIQVLHIMFIGLAGLLNSIAYATSPKVRQCVRHAFLRRCWPEQWEAKWRNRSYKSEIDEHEYDLDRNRRTRSFKLKDLTQQSDLTTPLHDKDVASGDMRLNVASVPARAAPTTTTTASSAVTVPLTSRGGALPQPVSRTVSHVSVPTLLAGSASPVRQSSQISDGTGTTTSGTVSGGGSPTVAPWRMGTPPYAGGYTPPKPQ
eukprot:TRINITY_DN7621_c0_g1_i1.p1 TRINITY_DN7621_c0_g1~~TRINITY_DN7621_c0_g1_i1.p1  ORF type:complete len:447 (-),score=46.38 TRINITY_DN7621_c0_g1_i1:112-1452(-)